MRVPRRCPSASAIAFANASILAKRYPYASSKIQDAHVIPCPVDSLSAPFSFYRITYNTIPSSPNTHDALKGLSTCCWYTLTPR